MHCHTSKTYKWWTKTAHCCQSQFNDNSDSMAKKMMNCSMLYIYLFFVVLLPTQHSTIGNQEMSTRHGLHYNPVSRVKSPKSRCCARSIVDVVISSSLGYRWTNKLTFTTFFLLSSHCIYVCLYTIVHESKVQNS